MSYQRIMLGTLQRAWSKVILGIVLLTLTACDPDVPPPTPTTTPQEVVVGPTQPIPETRLPQGTATQVPTAASDGCRPTSGPIGMPDAQSAYFRAEPPMRASVGEGHVLRGVVRSSTGCSTIPNARVIFWLAAPNGCYGSDTEATVLTDSAGSYSFSSNFPGIYNNNPPHIHLHVSAEGHIPIHLNYNTPAGQAEGTFDVVLAPGVLPTPSAPTPTPMPTEPCPPPAITTPTIAPETPTTGDPPSTTTTIVACTPTRQDAEGPFYVPNAPERISVGRGHMLRGVVRSSRDCSPIARARLEFWQVGPNAQYDDDHRATLYSDASGAYSFESNFPPGYSGRPPHIHVRVTAEGHSVLITQYYPQPGDTEGTFDLVLVPQP